MRELIRHILNESRLQQELKQVIEDGNIFDAADLVGGIKNLKKVLKDDPEFSEMLDELTGVVDFEIHDAFKDPRYIVFPLQYEIVGVKKNIWGTHSWPEINVIYDDSKLTSSEKKKFMTILSVIQNDNTVGKLNTKSLGIRDLGYFDVTQINGKDVDIHDELFPFSKEDVKRIHDKIYGGSESLNESHNSEIEKNIKAINVLLSLVSWDGLCDIWVDYNPDDDDYEIRSKTTRRYLDDDEIFRELNSLDDSIRSMGIKVYIYTPWYVDSCDEEVNFMNESLNESEKDTKKLFKIVKMIMEDLILPEYNHLICSYEITLNEVFNIPEVTVLFIGGYGTKLWPMTQGIRQMYLDVLEDISREIANYTGVVIGVRGEQTPKCDDEENIYLRESESKKKEYSPAGKEVTPKEKVYHQSNPMFRNKIEEQGLKVRAGECYKIYVGYGEKCIPAIFATNSSNKRAWFDSTYDDDVWEIDTTKIPNVKWYKDRHYESKSKHIVTFENIPRDAIKLIYEGSGKNSGLMESENKSEDKKLKLVKEMIYSLFDEVQFIEIDTNYQGKTLIKIYHDVEDTAANYDNWLEHKIVDEIQEMTGNSIILSPWWGFGWDWKYKNADFFIDVEKIKYDDEGNVINESDESKQERKFNKLVQKIEDELNSNEYPSVKKFTVYYDDTHDDVIVNIFFDPVESVKLGGGINSVIKKVGKQVMEDLDVFPLSFKYHIHFDRDINESTEKKPKYLKIIKDLVEPFKYEDCVCDIRVLYNEEDDMYLIDLDMGTKEMNEKFFAVVGMRQYVKNLRLKITQEIINFLPIKNFYVGSYASQMCGSESLNESTEKKPKYLNIIKDLIEPFKDEDGVCDINVSYHDDDDLYMVYIVMGTEEMNRKISYVPMMQTHISKLKINLRNTIKDYLPINNLYVGSYGKPNCNWNPINESSMKEKSLVKLIEKDGLYDFIEMTGLDFNQVRSLVTQLDNPKEILKQYIREFILEDDPNSTENSGTLIGVKIPLSNTKYVNDIIVQDSDQIAVEIWGYEEDEYGHTEQTEQYLTTINNLTNKELLSILSWMMENGHWN